MTDIHAIHPCPPNITINSSMVINVDQELIMGGLLPIYSSQTVFNNIKTVQVIELFFSNLL